MQSWGIYCTSEEFEKIRSDERFWGILTLARCINALRFCQKAELDGKSGAHPSDSLTSINSSLIAVSMLYEGFLLIEKLSRYYRDLKSFRNSFGLLLRDKAVTELRRTVLKRARNSFVFHFGEDVARESLEMFEVSVILFSSGYGDATSEIYFSLADEVATNYLLKPEPNETDDSLTKRRAKIVKGKETTEAIGNFTQSPESLMNDVIRRMGFVAKAIETT